MDKLDKIIYSILVCYYGVSNFLIFYGWLFETILFLRIGLVLFFIPVIIVIIGIYFIED